MATTFIQGNFKFEVIDEKKKTVRIMRKDKYTDFSGKLIIPSSVKENGTTYSVVEIGGIVRPYSPAVYKKEPDKRRKEGYREVFVSEEVKAIYGFDSTNISEVVIPDSVKCISYQAFKYCLKLKQVNLPKSLMELGEWAFFKTGLEKISIPGSIKIIPTCCFSDTSLEKVVIQEGVKEIKSGAFSSTKIKELSIPASVDRIHGALYHGAFYCCDKLKEVVIDDSDGTISIESEAFPKGCKILYKSQMGFFGKLFH